MCASSQEVDHPGLHDRGLSAAEAEKAEANDCKRALAVNSSRVVLLCSALCTALDLPQDPAAQPLRKAMHMMLLSGYHMEDIEVTFAMTLFTVRQNARVVSHMGLLEKVLVTLLHAYCAHCLVFDECIPCRVWHEWVFAQYCNPRMLTMALRKVCLLSKWRFNVPEEDLRPVLDELRAESSALDDDCESKVPVRDRTDSCSTNDGSPRCAEASSASESE